METHIHAAKGGVIHALTLRDFGGSRSQKEEEAFHAARRGIHTNPKRQPSKRLTDSKTYPLVQKKGSAKSSR